MWMFDQICEIWFVRFSFVLWTVFDTSFERSSFWIGHMFVIQTLFTMLRAKGVYPLSSLRAFPYGVSECVCVCVCVCVCACVRACVRVCVWLSLPLPLLHLLSSLRLPSCAPSFLRPPPPPERKTWSLHKHFECMIVNIPVKPNVMFEINFLLPDQRFHQENTSFFLLSFFSPPPPPPALFLHNSLS